MPHTYLDEGNLDQTDIAAKSTVEVFWLLRENLNFSYETFSSFKRSAGLFRLITLPIKIFSCDIVDVSNYERDQITLANLYREHQIETLAHAENMQAEHLQYAEFTADIFAIR